MSKGNVSLVTRSKAPAPSAPLHGRRSDLLGARLAAVALGVLLGGGVARAEIGDLTADRAIGQSSLDSATALAIGPSTFAKPRGIAIDRSSKSERIYVSDSAYHRILGWSDADAMKNGQPADIVLGQKDFTSYGCNGRTWEDGTVPAASLSSLCEPRGMAVDSRGSLYVADARNCRVLVYFDPFKTDPVADLVLGSGVCGGVSIDGSLIYDPAAVAVDAKGNVYVADTLHCRVLEYDGPLTETDTKPDRVLGQSDFTTQQCSGYANLYFPESLAFDPAGNLYVGSSAWLYEFDAPLTDTAIDRRLGTVSCNENGESASTTCGPVGVAIDDKGHLYMADAGNNRVLGFDKPLTVSQASRVFGQPGFTGASTLFVDECNNGGPSSASLCLRKTFALTLGGSYYEAAALATDGKGRLWVADGLNNRVLRYDSPLEKQDATLVLGQTAMDDVRRPVLPIPEPQVAVDNGAYAVVGIDTEGSRLLIYRNLATNEEVPTDVIGQPDLSSVGCNSGGLSAASLCHPTAAIVDGQGNLWVADTGNNRVLKYDYPFFRYDYAARQYVARKEADDVFGQSGFTSDKCGAGAEGLCGPRGVAVDARSNLYIADSANNRIVHHENPLADHEAERVYGQSGFDRTECDSEKAGPDTLCDPRQLAIDEAGDLFVADRGNNRVVVYDDAFLTDNVADRVFGQSGDLTANSCGGGAGGLCQPEGVGLDWGGNLFVADTANNRVLEFDAPLTATEADRVLGQSDFDSVACGEVGPESATARASAGGAPDADSLCRPVGLAISSSAEAVFVADAGNQRILRYDAPFCVSDFELSPATRRLPRPRSQPLATKLRVQVSFDGPIRTDILSFSGRLVLLERDGGISAGESPLLTLTTKNGLIYQETVPHLSNTKVGNESATYEARYLRDQRDSGIDDFKASERFVIPPSDDKPQSNNLTYTGRSVGLNLATFLETEATFRVRYGSTCFTTELTCRSMGADRSCSPKKK